MKTGKTARTFVLVLLFVALRGFGNLALAMGAKHFPEALSIRPAAYLNSMMEPFVALGIAMLVLSLFTRLALLSVADLGFVLPVTAVGYIMAAILGRFFLAESVTPQRWVATLLIFSGAALVGSTTANTTARGKAQ